MSNVNSTNDKPVNVFDHWRSISMALFMALAGYTVMVSVPVLSTALVEMLGFSEEQVGRVWGADLGGLSFGAIVSALLVARVNRRVLVLIGVVLSISANILCMIFSDYDQILWFRVVAGIGSGIFTAIAVVTLGGTTKPVRAFNMLLLGFAFSTAAELHIFPKLSMNEIFMFFIGITSLCGLLVKWIPARPLSAEQLESLASDEEEVEDWRVPKILPIICLIAIGFTYTNIGGYYTYIELAALKDGVAREWMTPILTWSSIFAIVGCVFAYFCTRFGLFKPLLTSLIIMAVVVIMLSTGVNDMNVVISLFSFMTLWTFIDVYQTAMMAHMDRRGTMVALVPSIQGFGQFVGPNIAASIIGAGMGYSMVFIVSGSMALVAMVLYLFVYLHMHKNKRQTSVAEAI